MSSGVGFINSTIILIICLGVLNCPFVPAVDNFERRYSYTSPFVSLSFILSLSIAVTTLCNIIGVGMINIASSIYFAYPEFLLLLNDFINGNTSSPTILYIFSAG